MSNPLGAISGVTSIIGGISGARSQKKAANAQVGAAEAGIEEQRRQFDMIRELLKPYVDAGAPALQQQNALLGLSGADAQQNQISQIESSPLFQSLLKQGEEGILQNASATGGLRGGNIQGALAQFRPAMLQSEIENRYSRLGGLTALGQQSAVGVGAAGQNMAGNVGSLLSLQGAARAQGTLGRNQAIQNIGGGLLSAAGQSGLGDLTWGQLNPMNWF
jgi:hypothetical protein